MINVLAKQEKIIPAPSGAEAVYTKGIRSVYQIEARSGWKGEIFTCVDVKHYDVANGWIIADLNIGNFREPDDAWKAFKSAIENSEWGRM